MPKAKKTILLTNDDGIHAAGLLALYKELKKIGNVIVVAPDGERSSISHAITLGNPLFYQKFTTKEGLTGYGITGTPADCVKFACAVVLKKKPDLVISGINHGQNDGCSVVYSGTVAGAREGALMGIASLAVSLDSFVKKDFMYSAKIAVKIAKQVLKNSLPLKTFLNINVPCIAASQIKGIKVTKQAMDPIHGVFHKRKNPHHKDYYWMSGRQPVRRKDLTQDTYALKAGYVTVVPIQCDSTNHDFLTTLSDWKI